MASKRAVEIDLTTDRAAYLPGEAVTARVRLVPVRDFEEVECSVALFHRDRYGIGDSTYTDDRAVAGEYVLDEDSGDDDLRAGVPREFTVVLPVPRRVVPPETPEDCADERYPPSGEDADAGAYDLWIEPDERWGPPTSTGPGASSEWLVRCEVTGAGISDDPVDLPVVVLSPPVPMPTEPAVRVGGGTPAAAVSFFGLPRGSVAPGTTLRGTVRVTAKEELKARGVRVELVRVATVTSGRGRAVTETVASTADASGELVLAARRPKDLAFTVDLPADAGASIVAEDYRVEWVLRAVVDRRLRRDEVWQQVVEVHTG